MPKVGSEELVDSSHLEFPPQTEFLSSFLLSVLAVLRLFSLCLFHPLLFALEAVSCCFYNSVSLGSH